MNRRTLKKRCRQAVAILIAEHRYSADCFTPADGSECVDAPTGMERRFVHRDVLTPGPLKGTPLYWYRCSYEYNEWDCKLPCVVLAEIEWWEKHGEEMARQFDAEHRAEYLANAPTPICEEVAR